MSMVPTPPQLDGSRPHYSFAPNHPATISVSKNGSFFIKYAGITIFKGRVFSSNHQPLTLVNRIAHGSNRCLTQTMTFEGTHDEPIYLLGSVCASGESIAMQTERIPNRFQFIRNEVGRSSNLLNNGVYDRYRDWLLKGDPSQTKITPLKGTNWHFSTFGYGKVQIVFMPAVYRRHKNIRYFAPWAYKPWRNSITGWCSWWAYRDSITEKDVHKVSKIFSEKLKDYGYHIIQIDDGYESGLGGTLQDWLHTNSKFPSGLSALSQSISGLGLTPGLWVNVHFNDPNTLKLHPDWFIQDSPGHPHKGPWIDYALNPSNREAVAKIIQPHYQALHKQGWKYVKIDTLRHFLYDSMYPSRDYLHQNGQTPGHLLRLYMKIARENLGEKTYILSCWGVLPDVVGYANGCRLGTDGYGPATLQQYTSWNNVVWRNDPDHCDLEPYNSQTKTYQKGQERIRATLASVAGAQLLLSDHPNVYEQALALDAARRVSPILFTQPGQLFDFDPSKTNNLIANKFNTDGGSNPGPLDADQFGKVCPWWALDINESYESWMVLTEMNWESHPLPPTSISFSDLGLDSRYKYLVFEGWNHHFLGTFKNRFKVPILEPNQVSCYAIRRLVDRPQLVSTNRHISQGAVDISAMAWKQDTLSGKTKLVKDFPYSMWFHVPAGFILHEAEMNGMKLQPKEDQGLIRLDYKAPNNEVVSWALKFSRS